MQRQTFLITLFGVLCSEGYRIAIIGGGIAGTFSAKFLADYDVNHLSDERDCLLDEIVVYDISPPPQNTETTNEQAATSTKTKSTYWQGSRVSSVTLKDGSVVELGASIIYEGNQLVVDTINGDPTHLKKGKPMGTGKNETGDAKTKKREPRGLGIYHGDGEWLLNTAPFSAYPSFLQPILTPLYFLWRYNLDYFRLKGAVKRAIKSFDMIYALLNDTQHEVTYFECPMDMWEAMGLRSLAGISFHDFLDALNLYRDESLEVESDGGSEASWWDWRKWMPGMGCMRSELVTAMTINTYNQNLNQMNGLVGLVAYVTAGGELFSIQGGNHKLLGSALDQAQKIYDSSPCKSSSRQRIQHHQKKITTVVASENSMKLYADEESLGKFDVVILAAPLQQCRVQFLVKNPMGMDESVLHDMPLAGLHDIDSSSTTNEHGQKLFPSPLPPSATVPYTTVTTTLVSNATLNATHFGLNDDDPWPRSILVSERGKLLTGELTTLTILSRDQGLMKTFSSEPLDLEKRNTLFGLDHEVEYIQVWGGDENGKYGGATPNFGGGNNSESLPYLLYDGSKHWGKGDAGGGPALYYVNAIESAVAAIEISAIGAKSTAKLVARRLGLIAPTRDGKGRDDEL